MVIERAKPWVRCWRLHRQRKLARRLASRARTIQVQACPVAFIVGCGRSGTTLMGEMLRRHPNVHYLFEPYHLWNELDTRNDAIQLHGQYDADMIRTAGDCNSTDQERFLRLFCCGKVKKHELLVEKTPYNAMRLGYLDALAPGARIIHMVRNGVDVARSIERLATSNSYRIAGRPNWNQWWGDNEFRWHALARDGARVGYYPAEVGRLTSHLQRGAYEWLVSIAEVDRHRTQFAGRLLDVNYDTLTADPRATLKVIADLLGITADTSWLDRAASLVHAPLPDRHPALELPPDMAGQFNCYQARFGFRCQAYGATK